MSSLSEEFQQALQESDLSRKIQALESLRLPRPSTNESLEDVPTSTLSYLQADHLLAEALTNLPGLDDRLANLQRATTYWCRFLETLNQLEFLEKTERDQLERLVEQDDDNDDSTNAARMALRMPSRDAKIAQFRALQAAQNEQARLQSLKERRGRLQIAETEALDGHDAESLERATALSILNVYKAQAFEGWNDVLRELPLLKRRMQATLDNNDDRRYPTRAAAAAPNQPSRNTGLQVTRVTQDAMTGQLHMKREEIRANVLRPGWNQPTMSLEELAEREVAAARQREEAQKNAPVGPRRYEQLVKEGLEDDHDLVDASAPLDRAWDNFKDENPRGSGNKRGDVGDRNF